MKNHAEKYKLGRQLSLSVDAGKEAQISHENAKIAVKLTQWFIPSPRSCRCDKDAKDENVRQGGEEERKRGWCPVSRQ